MMGALQIIAGLRFAACGLVVIFLVLAQQPSNDLGVMGGAAAYQSMQRRSTDARIANTTKYAGVAFFVLALLCGFVVLLAK